MAKKKSSFSDEIISRIQLAIKIISMVILLGFIILLAIEPTNMFWNNLYPSIQKITISTYFGQYQGTEFFLYAFPILLIAVLGCVYLYLDDYKSNDRPFKSTKKNRHLANLRRPILVKGPLGIVSATELAFFAMFVALLVWNFSVYLHNNLKRLVPISGENMWEAKLQNVALMLGVAGNVALIFLFFPVTRGSSVLALFGLTSEASIKYHIWVGHIVMILFTGHGLGYIIYWAATNNISEMLKWPKTELSNLAGELSLLAGLLLWATTFPRIRRNFFELFFYTHYLYILFELFYIFHLGIESTIFSLPGFYLFMVDRYLRFLQSRQRVRLVSSRILPCEALELNFSKSPGLKYNPTSIMFVNIPSISRLQWHPFTIHSNSNLDPNTLSILIKTEGSWTQKLHQKLSSTPSLDRLEVSVEGPYGPASTHFLRHAALVMVSGGSGISPLISVIRELVFFAAEASEQCKIPKVTLITAFKTSSDLSMLDILLPISGTPTALSNLQLEIKAYVTREKSPSTDYNSNDHARIIRFKPLSTDSPISAVLGPNSRLWLGAIISSSFIIFLVIIGVFTRYYVYPVDHNKDSVFSSVAKSAVNIWVACACIAVTASAAMLWNKKQIANEAYKTRNIDSEQDKELESFPRQSLSQVTSVHYGDRPDLKKLLSGHKEQSVGVLVCGPKKMRHEVASICSSGSVDNLHFEAISFNW
ncbi:hypothetical protein ACFE04_016809 [Oxalis oulophora]